MGADRRPAAPRIGLAPAISLAVVAGGSLYLWLRRGTFDLHLFNKSLAIGAIACLLLTLVVSNTHRRALGLTALATAALHSGLSLLALPAQFEWPDFYLAHPYASLLGLSALGLMIAIALGRLHPRRAVIALGLAGAHLVTLKISGWTKWSADWQPLLPPLSLLAAVTIAAWCIQRLLRGTPGG